MNRHSEDKRSWWGRTGAGLIAMTSLAPAGDGGPASVGSPSHACCGEGGADEVFTVFGYFVPEH